VSVLAKGKPLDTPTGLERGPDGQLYVADYAAGPHDTGAIFRVNPKNGHVHTVRIGPPLDETYGLDLDAKGNIYAAEASNAKGKPVIHRMDSSGRNLETFKDPLFGEPYGVVVGR
jgi:streptogramin lyase